MLDPDLLPDDVARLRSREKEIVEHEAAGILREFLNDIEDMARAARNELSVPEMTSGYSLMNVEDLDEWQILRDYEREAGSLLNDWAGR